MSRKKAVVYAVTIVAWKKCSRLWYVGLFKVDVVIIGDSARSKAKGEGRKCNKRMSRFESGDMEEAGTTLGIKKATEMLVVDINTM